MSVPFKKIEPPELDFDKSMLLRFGTKVTVEGKLERRIVANLCEYLIHHGWTPVETYDGEVFEPATTTKEVMENLFNVEEIAVRFTNGKETHGVALICGNGIDIVSDYDYSENDNFHYHTFRFDAENYA